MPLSQRRRECPYSRNEHWFSFADDVVRDGPPQFDPYRFCEDENPDPGNSCGHPSRNHEEQRTTRTVRGKVMRHHVAAFVASI